MAAKKKIERFDTMEESIHHIFQTLAKAVKDMEIVERRIRDGDFVEWTDTYLNDISLHRKAITKQSNDYGDYLKSIKLELVKGPFREIRVLADQTSHRKI